ncbi:uncharacterized protein LOC111037082 [Myzus persicae]|uniref:uncharacterized protein LOC111037082 n=1 Tax=Myzus persicae TaxID=13164 RepID=UPI000B9360BD|nr:uncharacterized protein LOC111037082 [Myzus persicae]
MVSNHLTRLVNWGEDIFLQFKIYQIRRSIIKSKTACPSISWYILAFVISSLMMKAVNGLEKWCLCNDYYSCPVVADFVQLSNIEEEIEEFLSCHFEEYWSYAYTTTSTICDVLVIIGVLKQNHRLVYPWLVIKLIALIANMSSILYNFVMSKKSATTLHLVVLVDLGVLKLAHNLTERHLAVEGCGQMNVKTIEQVLSGAVGEDIP